MFQLLFWVADIPLADVEALTLKTFVHAQTSYHHFKSSYNMIGVDGNVYSNRLVYTVQWYLDICLNSEEKAICILGISEFYDISVDLNFMVIRAGNKCPLTAGNWLHFSKFCDMWAIKLKQASVGEMKRCLVHSNVTVSTDWCPYYI